MDPVDQFVQEDEERLEQFLRQARKAKKEDIALAESMTRLLRNNDFQLYLQQVLGRRIEDLGALLLEPSLTHDGMVKTEFTKGAMYAFCLARDIPSVIVKSMSEMKSTQENE